MKKQNLVSVILCVWVIPLTIKAVVPIFGDNDLISISNKAMIGLHPSTMPPPGFQHPDWQNMGNLTVIACGHDAMGIWRTIPMRITYRYNGLQYDATIKSAWNPWKDGWDYDLNLPAVNTYFTQGNQEYDFYVVLSTGTFYFNL